MVIPLRCSLSCQPSSVRPPGCLVLLNSPSSPAPTQGVGADEVINILQPFCEFGRLESPLKATDLEKPPQVVKDSG